VKKVGIALLLVLALAGATLVGLRSYGFNLFGLSYTWNEELAQLDKLARSFLQDLQFKDFAKAGKYHSFLDQGKADIPKLIERLFQVKPEVLNIRDFEIVKVDLDEDGKRARTFFRSNLELLNTAEGDKPNKEKQIEGILYWHKLPVTAGMPPSAEGAAQTTTDAVAAEAEQWFMKLESSLR
jgi:hypothetical protein